MLRFPRRTCHLISCHLISHFISRHFISRPVPWSKWWRESGEIMINEFYEQHRSCAHLGAGSMKQPWQKMDAFYCDFLPQGILSRRTVHVKYRENTFSNGILECNCAEKQLEMSPSHFRRNHQRPTMLCLFLVSPAEQVKVRCLAWGRPNRCCYAEVHFETFSFRDIISLVSSRAE